VALTCISDPNRSTANNFIDVNGMSLYIADWRMIIVEEGYVLHNVNREGGIVREGEMSGYPLETPQISS